MAACIQFRLEIFKMQVTPYPQMLESKTVGQCSLSSKLFKNTIPILLGFLDTFLCFSNVFHVIV